MDYEYAIVYPSDRFEDRYSNETEFLYDAFMSLKNAYGHLIILCLRGESYLTPRIEEAGLETMRFGNQSIYTTPENTIILALSCPSDELHKNRRIRKLELQGYVIEHAVIQPLDNEEYIDLLKGGLL